MNKKEYILKLKHLKAIIDDEILQGEIHKKYLDSHIIDIDIKKVKELIVLPIWKLLENNVKQWIIFIGGIHGPNTGDFQMFCNTVSDKYTITPTDDELDSFIFAKDFIYKERKTLVNLMKVFDKEICSFTKLRSIFLYSTKEKFFIELIKPH